MRILLLTSLDIDAFILESVLMKQGSKYFWYYTLFSQYGKKFRCVLDGTKS